MGRQRNNISDRASEAAQLLSTVVDGGYCIGCGACGAVKGSPLKIAPNRQGLLRPRLDSQTPDTGCEESFLDVCPFSGAGPDEDQLGKQLFGTHAIHDSHIGYYIATYAGHVAEGEYRLGGSSGGMGTWMLVELFRQGLIDAAIHVQSKGEKDSDSPLFEFQISRCVEDVQRNRSKSAYFPVEMSQVLQRVRETPGRYALVGVPCFVKAARLLARQDPMIGGRIVFCVGLVCGHLKSARYPDFLAWQCGIQPGTLEFVDFRKKLPGTTADRYFNEFAGKDASGSMLRVVRAATDYYCASWGYGLFMYAACDFCDDVVAETADITIGDAWLPRYVRDWRGDNILIVRNPTLQDVIQRALREGRLVLDVISVAEVIASQAGCYRHRRDGLAYRLLLKDQAGKWRPPKRVSPRSDHLNSRLKRKYSMRAQVAAASHEAFERAVAVRDFNVMRHLMQPLISAYDKVNRPALRRLLSFVKQSLRRLIA